MKTTDSVMREFDNKYPQGITALKFVGGDWIEFDVTKEIKALYSRSLAEARREITKEIETLKKKELKPENRTLELGIRISAYNQAIDDVLNLLTGDNPERKV